MKKTLRLRLNKETLRHLSGNALRVVFGGEPLVSFDNPCVTPISCGCPTLTSAACDSQTQCPTVNCVTR